MVTLAIILLPLIYFYNITIFRNVIVFGDNLLAIAPYKIFFWNQIKHGVFPLWNQNKWAGFPEFADVTSGTFDPFNLFYLFFHGLQASTIIFIICGFLSLAGTYLFLRHNHVQRNAALLGAIIFAFSGSMINIAADVIRAETICFLPWILFVFEKKHYLVSILLLWLCFLIGQTQYFYIIVFFITVYLLVNYPFGQNIKQVIIFIICMAASLCLAAFLLFPQLELLQYSSRINGDSQYSTIWSLHPLSIVRFFIADFFGKHNQGSFWGPDITYSFGYVGFFTLIFLLTNLRKINRKGLIFLIISILTLLISLGKYNPVYFLFGVIPGFMLFRNPTSWLTLYSFSIACLVAYIADTKLKEGKSVIPKKLLIFFMVFFVLSELLILFISKIKPDLFFLTLKSFALLLHKNISSFHTIEVDRQIAMLIGGNLMVLGLLSIVLLIKNNVRTLLLIIFIDLFIFAKNDLIVAPNFDRAIENVSQEQHAKFLQKNLGNYRFVSTSEFIPMRGMSIYMTQYSKRPPFFDRNFWLLSDEEIKTFKMFKNELRLLPPNINVAHNLPSINGYSGFYLKYYGKYFADLSLNLSESAKRIYLIRQENKDPLDPSHVNFNFINLDDPRLSQLSVKYILSNEKLNLPKYKEIDFHNGFFIYENPRVLPRAQIFDKNNQLTFTPTIKDISPNEVKIVFPDYTPKKGDYLLLRDVYYPGWIAENQTGEKMLIKQKDIFRKVPLIPTTKEINLRFHPSLFYFGLKISVITSLFLVIMFFLKTVWREKEKKLSFAKNPPRVSR